VVLLGICASTLCECVLIVNMYVCFHGSECVAGGQDYKCNCGSSQGKTVVFYCGVLLSAESHDHVRCCTQALLRQPTVESATATPSSVPAVAEDRKFVLGDCVTSRGWIFDWARVLVSGIASLS
jgi:hypothetical protein